MKASDHIIPHQQQKPPNRMALRGTGGGHRDGRLSQPSLTPLKLFSWYIESQGRILDDWIIGESLFTLFASLTYAYHYLMTLIK